VFIFVELHVILFDRSCSVLLGTRTLVMNVCDGI